MKRKKRLLICSPGLEVGGVERSLIGVLHCLDYETYDVDLFLYAHVGEYIAHVPKAVNILPEMREYSNFRKSIAHIMLRGHVLNAGLRVAAKIFCLARKVIQGTHGPYMTRAFQWSLPFLPNIAIEYDLAIGFLTPFHVLLQKVKAQKKIGWVHTDYKSMETGVDISYELKMWEKLDVIIAVSEEVKKTFVEVFPRVEGKVNVIENILISDIVRQKALESDGIEIPNKCGCINICTVGRLSYAKGIDVAILACRKLVDQGYQVIWYVIGFGPEKENIQRMIVLHKVEKCFFLIGKKVNPYPYMKACDIYVQPSRYEGKSVTVREAQILGLPVVITNYNTARSQVVHGVDGHISPMGVDGIVEGIKYLIDHPEYRMKLVCNAAEKDYGNETEINKLYQHVPV